MHVPLRTVKEHGNFHVPLHSVTTNFITWNRTGRKLSILKYVLFYSIKVGNKRIK